jgi:hypothetical protein
MPSEGALVRVSQASGGIPSHVSDAVFAIKAASLPSIRLSRTALNMACRQYSYWPASSQTVMISNAGGGTPAWTATASAGWISVNPKSGEGDGIIEIGFDVSQLGYYALPGIYSGTVTISDPAAANSPR